MKSTKNSNSRYAAGLAKRGIAGGAFAACAILLALVTPARANLYFTPDLVVDFSSLTPGTVLHAGDQIAPGITFYRPGSFTADEEATVVDLGGGVHALQMVTFVNPLGHPVPSLIEFDFTGLGQTVSAAGFDAQVVTSGNGNPGFADFSPTNTLIGAWGEGATGSFSMSDWNVGNPGIGYLQLECTEAPSPATYQVNDLAIKFAVPEPASLALLAFPGLLLLLRRRRRD